MSEQTQEPQTLPPHVERMYKERDELHERWIKLNQFKETPAFSELPDYQKSFLHIQAKAMETYHECLTQRIIFS